jgi:4-phytase/acid phosphatase/peptide/nickel transport system substrate-binding protein
MTAAVHFNALARIFLVAGFAVSLSAVPASAQKKGGSITVGLELDIPGFDPLKVGVFDTAALTAASALFETLTYLDDKAVAQPRLALSWTHSDDFKTWTYKLRPGVKFHDGTPFNAQAVKEISTVRRIRPTSAVARSTSPTSKTCRRPMSRRSFTI